MSDKEFDPRPYKVRKRKPIKFPKLSEAHKRLWTQPSYRIASIKRMRVSQKKRWDYIRKCVRYFEQHHPDEATS